MSVVVETSSGPIEGREKENVLLFAGVPYAAPPIGSLRFRAARPHDGWREVREAKKFGPAAPQIATGGMTNAAPVRWDEDCLTLNVCTPAIDDIKRPVLVWIHGGGYRTGQGGIPWYNGTRFAVNGGIVVVSINYRLGALGFTDLSRFGGEFATSGVNGILDQITALQWVRDNIERFGGDPAKVTIAGESAGGFSVATLLGAPRAQGLFLRAIPQSGAAHHTLPAAAGTSVADAFLTALDADGPMHLEAASVDDVLQAQQTVSADLEGGTGLVNQLGVPVGPFYPVIGNDVLDISPLDAIADGLNATVPVLTGTNRDETTLWGYGDVDDAKLARTAAAFGNEGLVDAYRAQRPDASAEALMIAMTTDHMFRIPAIRLAEAREPHDAATWMYRFDWESRAFNGRLKATHALEIPFAFDNLDRGGVDAFLGDGPLPQHVADAMHAAWTSFIHSGDPGWMEYRSDERTTMLFNDTSQTENDPAGDERRAWEGLR